MGVNVGQVLCASARRWPERRAVLDVGTAEDAGARRAFSFAELDAAARRVAGELRARGVEPGAAVALIAENCAELMSAWFGVVYAGCAVVPVPFLSAAPELRFRIEHARCAAVLFDAARAQLVQQACAGLALPALDLHAAVQSTAEPVGYVADTAPGDTAMVLYTSGTTGQAKGAAISHASLFTHTMVLAHHALRLGTDDRVLGVLPLTHSYGCRMVMLASAFAGAQVVLVSRFHAARTLRLLCEERISWAPVVPTMLAAWGAEPGEDKPSALRWVLSAGAPLADAVALRAEARLGTEVRQGYGMTEATFTTINAPPDARVLGSVGKPAWGINVRVVDADGRDVPPGHDGEVLVRGHNVMTRYLHDGEASSEVLRGGFMHSGDVGRFDAEGRLTLVDRIKDLIIRGGNNVYPSEVEDALATHPGVREVAVVGRADAYYGEEVVAVVVRSEGASASPEELVEHCRARISRTKLPHEVAFVDAFPLGPSGKVQKRLLRAWIAEGRVVPQRVAR